MRLKSASGKKRITKAEFTAQQQDAVDGYSAGAS